MIGNNSNNTLNCYPEKTNRYPSINIDNYPDNAKNCYPSINNYPNKTVANYPNNKNIEKLKEEYTEKFLINEDSGIYNDSENISTFLNRIGYEEEIIFDKSQNKWILSKSNF